MLSRRSKSKRQQIVTFIENEGFPVPIGFTESDLFKGKQRLFTDIFCLNYLHIMTLHGLLGHSTSLGVSVRKDLRDFYDSCDNDGKRMYHQTIDLLLEKGSFQRDPLFYPAKSPEYVSSQDFTDGFFGKGRTLAATEIIVFLSTLKKVLWQKLLQSHSVKSHKQKK